MEFFYLLWRPWILIYGEPEQINKNAQCNGNYNSFNLIRLIELLEYYWEYNDEKQTCTNEISSLGLHCNDTLHLMLIYYCGDTSDNIWTQQPSWWFIIYRWSIPLPIWLFLWSLLSFYGVLWEQLWRCIATLIIVFRGKFLHVLVSVKSWGWFCL